VISRRLWTFIVVFDSLLSTTFPVELAMFLDDFDVDDYNAELLVDDNITTELIIVQGRCSLLSYTVTS